MKLKEIKKVLIGKVDSYTTLTKMEENGELYEVEYSLNPLSGGPEYILLRAIFEKDIFKDLQEIEVKSVSCNDSGFVIELSGKETYKLFEEIIRHYQIPLVTKKYIIIK